MLLLAQRFRTIAPSQTGRRLITTTLWSVVAEGLSRGLLLLSMVVVARTLGTESYGEFGMVRSTISVFATLGGMGLGLTANRFVAQYRDKDKQYSGHIIGSSYLIATASGVFVGLAVLLGARQLAAGALHAPQLVNSFRISALLLLLSAINGAQIGILQGLEAYGRLALGSLIQGVSALIFLVAGSHFYGVQGAVGGLLVYTCAGALIFHGLIRRELRRQEIPVIYTDFAATLPIFWKFSLPVMLAGIAIAPLKWLAETMLVRKVGFAELGIFAASMTVATVLNTLVGTLNAPLISLAANVDGAPNTRKMQYVNLYGSWYMMVLLALPIVVFPRLASLPFGDKYATTQFYAVTLLLSLYCALMMYYQGVMRLVALNGSMWFGFYTNLLEGASLLLGFFLFADRGAAGLALAYVFSYIVRVLASMPHLFGTKIIPARLLFDKYFILSLALLSALVAFQVRALP